MPVNKVKSKNKSKRKRKSKSKKFAKNGKIKLWRKILIKLWGEDLELNHFLNSYGPRLGLISSINQKSDANIAAEKASSREAAEREAVRQKQYVKMRTKFGR